MGFGVEAVTRRISDPPSAKNMKLEQECFLDYCLYKMGSMSLHITLRRAGCSSQIGLPNSVMADQNKAGKKKREKIRRGNTVPEPWTRSPNLGLNPSISRPFP